MKTTLELPDELLRAIKVKAAKEDRRLKDLVADLLQAGLAAEAQPRKRGRQVKLPLIQCAHPATPESEMTPERLAAILMDQEVEAARPPVR